MGSIDAVLWIPRFTVKVFDGVRLDLDIHVVELGMVIIVCTLVAVFHCLS